MVKRRLAPFVIRRCFFCYMAQRATNEDMVICGRNAVPDTRIDEGVANAHLIAAAPELYEALEDIVEYVSSIFTSTELNNLCKEARKALAKARGETGERRG